MSIPRFLVDECLSPQLARRLAANGHDATSVRDRAKLGTKDGSILDFATSEDRIIVTQNAQDFRQLVGAVELHPGLIILTANSIELSWAQLAQALEHAEQRSGRRMRDWMVNRVVEVDSDGVTDYELPKPSPREEL